MFTNVNEAIEWMGSRKKTEKRKDLHRIEKALKYLGNPEKSYKKIHIAGTNGKGSTVAFTKSILLEDNYSVGTFISPFVVCFNERITYNYGYISNEEILQYANMIYPLIIKMDQEGETIPFFEILLLIAFCYFRDKHVDYAIIEVGLGGYLDPTNVIVADVSVITNIGYDHMAQLGNSLEEIAMHKVRIVKPGGYLITTTLEENMEPFYEYLADINATVHHINTDKIFVYDSEFVSFVYENEIIDLSVIGIHQAYNATLAIETVKYLIDDFPMKKIKTALLDTTWPGRLERVSLKPRVLLDGAHNIHGIEALIKTVERIYKNRKLTFIMSILKDKETSKMINAFVNSNYRLVFTDFDYPRVKKADELAKECNMECSIITPYTLAISEEISNAKDDDVIIITGSLYFVSFARNYLKEILIR